MEINSKKLERTSKFVYTTISIILCIFLILLSNKIIGDLDTTTVRPEIESFQNQLVLNNLNNKISYINNEIENLNSKQSSIEKTIETAKANRKNEQQSFDNWVQTRKTLGSPDKDQEVITRAKKLDDFYKVENDWNSQYNEGQKEIETLTKKLEAIQNNIDKENEKAESRFNVELKKYDLKVFLIRLLFVAPILLLGIFFLLRYRKNKFWPLYFGFTLFSLYAFFFGLVPYLPSYGGYIRYSVGILLSVLGGYYSINRIRQFLEQKKIELETSSQDRAKNVQTDTADKALMNHVCPSCGKDFILKNWEHSSENSKNLTLITDYCRFCGLKLFSKCEKCDNKNFIHLPYCSNCGEKIKTK